MRAFSASIVDPDPASAGRTVAAELLDELGGPPELVLAFVSSRLDPAKALEGLVSRLPASVKIAGCSSFAEINSEEALEGSVTAMGFRDIDCEVLKVDNMGTDSRDAGRRMGLQAQAAGAKLLITFSDGIQGIAADYLRGLQDVLGATFPIVGGVAAEHLTFQATHELWNRQVLVGGAVAVAIRNDFAVATAARSGFQPVGAPRTITAVQGKNLILSLDGQPALKIYKDFLGDSPPNAQMVGIEFPLMIVVELAGDYMLSDEQSNVVRVVRALDEEHGGLVLGGEVSVGMRVRLTRALKDDLLRGSVNATTEAMHKVPSPDVALIFGCAGRKLILGPAYQEEMRRAFAAMPAGIPKIGFYTYGELSPVRDVCTYHDETFTIALLKSG